MEETKFCTSFTCSISSHQVKLKHFWVGLYLKAGQNAVYCTPMLPTACIPGKQLASWLEENDTSMGIWHERFKLSNTIQKGNSYADEASKDFFKCTREMKTPLHQIRNKGTKHKTPPVDKQQDDADTTDDIALVKPVKVKVSNKRRKEWVVDHTIPADFKELIEAVEVSVHSLVVHAIGNPMTLISRETATDNINARLTSLEDFVG
eukprot:6494090-Ditylum_brightwellii.AAC.1